ncbi:MAG: hypothetical protein KAJ44_00330 [Thermoplasmatales archaeon]|nr:hypothetical protein [Thermoplasmatales archaeon]
MNRKTNNKCAKRIGVVVIIVALFLLNTLPVTTLANNTPQNEDFTLSIYGGFGYTIDVNNRGTQEIVVNHTTFAKGIFREDIVRNVSDSLSVPAGARHRITTHPVFCMYPFVNITVTMSAGSKSLTRNGIQFFSKIHIFLTGNISV